MKLQVTMLDRLRTEVAIVHENQHVPYGRRQVTIELTPEQAAQLAPHSLGWSGGSERFEEIGEVWIEQEITP